MEFNGIRVNPQVLAEQKTELAQRMVQLRDQIHEAAGEPFNIESPKQLADILFQKLKLPVTKKTKTGPSTDIEVLERLCELENIDAPRLVVPKLMVEYRQLSKLVGTYLDALRDSINPRTGRVHATFHQTGAATGRLSSSGPNLQNIPIRTELGRQIRKAFVAEPGHQLISADYSQIELRILAHLSEDPALMEAFRAGLDIHAAVAAQVFNVPLDQVTREQRGHAKVINFGIVYGVTPYGLARRIEGLDVERATQLIRDYKMRFAGIGAFLEKCIQQAEELGYVTTMMGRRRAIQQIRSANRNQRSLGERLAINSVVQGSAADLIKLAMVNLHRRIERERLPMKLLLQIHDELVLEAPVDAAPAMAEIVRAEMETAMKLRVPLKAEAATGADWLAAK
jgi:DNA polymerase I